MTIMDLKLKHHSSGKQGFTFTEVIIALSLFLVLAGVGVGAYFRYYNFALVDMDVQEAMSLLDETRFKAQKNSTSSDYGIHLDPTTRTLTQYKESYVPNAPSNKVVKLQVLSFVQISLDPVPGVTSDILFGRQTGKTVNSGFFTVGDSDYSYTFHVNIQGVVD